jgi:hypothetical protein
MKAGSGHNDLANRRPAIFVCDHAAEAVGYRRDPFPRKTFRLPKILKYRILLETDRRGFDALLPGSFNDSVRDEIAAR